MQIPQWQRDLCKGDSDDLTKVLLERWLFLAEKERGMEFANVPRAAAIAGVAPRTMLDWINQGLLACVPIGRKHRVYLPSLKSFLAMRAEAWAAGDKPILKASARRKKNARHATGNSRG